MAAFCKCGYYDIKEVGKLFGIGENLVEDGQAELDQVQVDIKRKVDNWVDKSHTL